jgi:hypothetical protein
MAETTEGKPGEDTPIELSALIRSLRAELRAAIAEGEGEPLRFALDEIELDLEVSAVRSVEPRGGVKFWVVTAGVGAKFQQGHVQRLKLKLTPRTERNGKLMIADDSGQVRK